MSGIRPFVLSIAGHDPSGGAGLMSDIKTFEMHRTYGLGVCSAVTFQNDREFERCDWIKTEDIIYQIKLLFRNFDIKFVKIGLIENVKALTKVLDYLKSINKDIKVIFDPILKASAGFTFHGKDMAGKIANILDKIYLATPNWNEFKILFPSMEMEEVANQLGQESHIMLKGGHHEKRKGVDHLIRKGNIAHFEPDTIAAFEKHGSGCVLSSSITANLALGYPVDEACLKAKQYVSGFLESSKSLLGYHYE